MKAISCHERKVRDVCRSILTEMHRRQSGKWFIPEAEHVLYGVSNHVSERILFPVSNIMDDKVFYEEDKT